MDVLSLLPLLSGWRYEAKDVDYPFVVRAGEEKLLAVTSKPGWLHSAICFFDNPEASFVVRLFTPYETMHEVDMVPSNLKLAELTQPNPTGLWCSRYEPGPPPMYVVVFTPSMPMPFTERISLSIKAPKNSNVTVYGYTIITIVIEDKETFINSLRKIIS